MNKFDHLSFSSITRYVRCPRHFYKYITEKKPLPAEASLKGTMMHAEIAKMLEDNNYETNPAYGEKFKRFCRYILQKPVGIEQKFTMDFLTQKVVGVIDSYSIHGDQAVICDWKSFYTPYGGYTEPMQLKIYALAVKEKHPEVKLVHGYFFYIKSDFYDVISVFEDEIDAFSHELSGIIDAISTDKNFDPVAGEHCNRCRYSEDCPITKNFKISALKTIEEVREFANKTFALETLLSQSKDRIKEFLLNYGLNELPIDAENRYYITTSPVFRIGKIQSPKKKTAADKLLNIAASVKCQAESDQLKAGNVNNCQIADNTTKIKNKGANIDENKDTATVTENSTTAENNEIKLAISKTENSLSEPDKSIIPISAVVSNKTPVLASDESIKVKMGEINQLLVELNEIETDAPSWKISSVVKKFLGKNFTMATDSEKYELKLKLNQMLLNKIPKIA
ncbi:MAG: PD-(D/E)XK nuclease family protein [Candidatus Wallbacteria bacterium]